MCQWVQKASVPKKMVKGTEPKGSARSSKPKHARSSNGPDSEESSFSDILDRKAKGESVPALAAASGKNQRAIFRYVRILTAASRSPTAFALLF